ncbi:DUF1186 domain-containing protein [Roseinatronobacter sp.]|uniref:DUF1186 domain-containing protein n=1 Tax=Roseinatronobacter sp. TaxID=1945755 RepID=UPI0025F2B6C7|nr:DUF1186 domain-containing protein [Roseibaca sp.]
MTPTEIMAAYEDRGPLPRDALMAAGQSREAMVPVFLEYIETLQSAEIDDLDDLDAFIFIFYLLAEWRETRAYRPLARLLRRDPVFLDMLLGDAITETSARVMAAVFDGDLQPIFDILLDGKADSFLRGEMFDTLAILALDNPDLRPRITQFLIDFFDLAGPDTSEDVWWAWTECVAALGLENMETQVRAVFDSGLIAHDHSRFEDFKGRLQATVDAGQPDWFTDMNSNTLITDTVAELESWYCFSPEYLRKKAEGKLTPVSDLMPRAGDPFNSVLLGKTGRNDPCPCGSGRKFKKCCLQ